MMAIMGQSDPTCQTTSRLSIALRRSLATTDAQVDVSLILPVRVNVGAFLERGRCVCVALSYFGYAALIGRSLCTSVADFSASAQKEHVTRYGCIATWPVCSFPTGVLRALSSPVGYQTLCVFRRRARARSPSRGRRGVCTAPVARCEASLRIAGASI